MPRIPDMAGRSFGGITVVKFYGMKSNRRACWECLCDCGNTFYLCTSDLTGGKRTCCPKCSNVKKAQAASYPRSSESTFWAKVDKKSPNDCWEWTAQLMPGKMPYGRMMYSRKRWLTHRLAWTFTFGQIPEGLLVCHKCDNPKCCNPSHLFLGTDKDNFDDMANKGRNMQPPLNRKLPTCDVEEIKRLHKEEHMSGADISRIMGVTNSHVCSIINGKYRANG